MIHLRFSFSQMHTPNYVIPIVNLESSNVVQFDMLPNHRYYFVLLHIYCHQLHVRLNDTIVIKTLIIFFSTQENWLEAITFISCNSS